MKRYTWLFLPLLIVLTWAHAHAQAATRPVNVTWNQTAVTNATGYNLYEGPSATGPWTKLNSTPLAVSSPSFADVGTVGETRFYGVTVVTPACTPTTPVTTPCGESDKATASTTVPPRPGSTTTVVVSVP